MKNQALFALQDKTKKLKCLLQFLLLHFIPGSRYLPPAKKLISNTAGWFEYVISCAAH